MVWGKGVPVYQLDLHSPANNKPRVARANTGLFFSLNRKVSAGLGSLSQC